MVRNSVAPLFGVSLNWPAGWPDLRRALTGHVSGNAAATQALRHIATNPPHAGSARCWRSSCAFRCRTWNTWSRS
jgi:hypothetical protein